MIYVFKHIVVRTKKEVNEVYKSLFDDDYYDTSAEDYNGEEIITGCDEFVKINQSSFEIRVDDGTDERKEFDMWIYRYRVEHWHNNIGDGWSNDVIDNSDEVLDPENYSTYCSGEGDEIRVYNNHTNELIDSFKLEIKAKAVEAIAEKIEDAFESGKVDFERYDKPYVR